MLSQAADPRPPAARNVWQRLAEADLTLPRNFLALAIVYLLFRLPLLFYGYGTDPDSWRVALTGHYLLSHGEYYPSRLPGYPLQEFLVAPLVPLGPIATNFETSLVFLAGVYVFGRIAGLLQLPQRGLLTFTFAFAPLLVINSVSTMDYVWTLTLILAGYYAALRGGSFWAGVYLGLAVGMRLPATIAWLPLAYTLTRRGRLREVIPLSLAAAGVGLLARAPTVVVYGPSVLNFYDAALPWQSVARLLAKEGLGAIGVLAVLAGAALSYRGLLRLPRDLVRDPETGAWVLMILATLLVFFRLPHKIGYILPLFPFGFFLMARYYARFALTVTLVAILLAGFVDLTIHQGPLDLASFRHAGLGKGLLLANVETMQDQTGVVQSIRGAPLPNHSVVIVGFAYPQLAVRSWGKDDVGILQKDYDAISMLTDRGQVIDERRDIRYVWLLTYQQFLSLRGQGYSFFMTPDAEVSTYAVYHYRPAIFGAEFIPAAGGKAVASGDIGGR